MRVEGRRSTSSRLWTSVTAASAAASAEAVTSLMFSLLRRALAEGAVLGVAEAHLGALTALVRTGESALIRANAAGMLGALGQMPHNAEVSIGNIQFNTYDLGGHA